MNTLKAIGCLLILNLLWLIPSCATGKWDPSLISLTPEYIYISPANQDGIQDKAQFPLSIPEIDGAVLAGYRISVTNEKCEEIFSISEGKTVPEGKKRIAGRKTPLPFPETIGWDGKDRSGAWAADGIYSLGISAWDYNGVAGSFEIAAVIVDNTPPAATVSMPYAIFSPNGDGNRDFLDFYLQSSVEELWSAEILTESGDPVMRYAWPGLVRDFRWEGMNREGAMLGDGTFLFKLESTDRAGNSFVYQSDEILMQNRFYALSIKSDVEAFSPNRDRSADTVTFSLSAENPDQLSSVSFHIINQSGQKVRELSLQGKAFPANIVFDGRDRNSKFLPEGYYYGVFSAVYENGNTPTVTSFPVELDVTAPHAVLSRSLRIFSPDGDGIKDEITINQSTSTEALWTGAISDTAGRVARSYSWNERAVAFDWDGLSEDGEPAPDGSYQYNISSTDKAGNRASFQSGLFFVDRRETPVHITNGTAAFSPNGDGIRDYAEFHLKPTITEGITRWQFSIVDEAGETVYDFGEQQNRAVPVSLSWSGESSSDEVTEGSFFSSLTVEYEKGNLVTARSTEPVVLDISPPEISYSLKGIPFSPDGDGENDSLEISIDVRDQVSVRSWSASIIDPMGRVFLNIPGSSFQSGKFLWDGRSARGELVQSASDYKLRIRAEDSVGNASRAEEEVPTDILVLREGDRLKISLSSIYFKPFTADYLDLEESVVLSNLLTLDRLAEVLKKYSAYRIRIEGHAVRVYWDKPDRWLKEETEVLMPLSAQRAEAIRDALVLRGLAAERITTGGNGGYETVVPHSDADNRWKNRRVEFILIK